MDKKFNVFIKKFSPPYGDGTMISLSHFAPKVFSPPYGDGTVKNKGVMNYG